MSAFLCLSRKQRLAKLPPARLLNNGTSTGEAEEASTMEEPRAQTPLSMIVPRRAISDSRFAKLLPEQQSSLVEVQCKNFDLFPILPISSAVAAV